MEGIVLFLFAVGGLVGLAVYFVPTLIALVRSHNIVGVLLVNLLVGWTFLGWVVALVMACGSKPQPTQVYVNHSAAYPGPPPAAPR